MKLALAGDTMLGRRVGEHLAKYPVRAVRRRPPRGRTDTDLFILNLECAISDRGDPWPARALLLPAPRGAVDALVLLGVRWVTLANNHALDYGPVALLDTSAPPECRHRVAGRARRAAARTPVCSIAAVCGSG